MKKDSYLLFFAQVIAHLSIIPLILYGHWYHYLAAFAVYFITGCLGMTMTFHRLLSHRSYNPPKWFYYLGTLCGFYGLTGSPLAWAAVHREHHRYTDKELDPHSPLHKSFFRVQWLSMFEDVKPRYVPDLLRDGFQLFLHKNYFQIHLAIAITFLLIDPFAMVYLYLVPAAILWNAGSFINTLTHMIGYRNHETKDSSTNVFVLGYLMWGEGWHNNHHASPASAQFGEKWWEIDIGGILIKRLDTKLD